MQDALDLPALGVGVRGGVGVVQGLGDLTGDRLQDFPRHSLAQIPLQNLLQRSAVHVLHHQELRPPPQMERVETTDVRVRQLQRDERLALQGSHTRTAPG
ncbi:MAG: hypothetical protein AMK72_08135 [Planctomycetes bacterium SM23_25]|nr:MAG: hypothetical protein AMK72_08135 [Planctomycetes bacterium SM23_25]